MQATVPVHPEVNLETDKSLGVWFSKARTVDLREEDVKPPQAGEVTIDAVASLVSRGTEMLVFRGELPGDMPLGMSTAAGAFSFPVKYGYQIVGRVTAVGEGAEYEVGDLVFARHPHQTRFTMPTANGYVRKLDPSIDISDALFINLTDVALGAMHDAPVRYGDVVVVFGLGIVGTIAALLAQETAKVVFAVDPLLERRASAERMGLENVLAPDQLEAHVMKASAGRGADIVVEASGNAKALQQGIDVCGLDGTIAVVSLYGASTRQVSLNERFHMMRQRIISSQVSGMGAGLDPRWDKARRFDVASQLATRFRVGRLISHEARIDRAAEGYRRLDSEPNSVVALAINYTESKLRTESEDV